MEIRDVHAGDQHDAKHGSQHRVERGADPLRDRLGDERRGACRDVLVFRIRRRQLAGDRGHLPARLIDADAMKADYLEELEEFRGRYRKDCTGARIDYVPLHTGLPFDKALMSYLQSRQARG